MVYGTVYGTLYGYSQTDRLDYSRLTDYQIIRLSVHRRRGSGKREWGRLLAGVMVMVIVTVTVMVIRAVD
jgi:hypothetical protein